MIDRERLVRWYDWQAPFYRMWRNRYDDPLLERIEALLPDSPSPVILDAACGTGFVSIALARRARGRRIVGVDLSIGMVRVARREQRRFELNGIIFATGDVLSLPIADASMDAIVIAGLIPFLDDPLPAARELHRVLRPGGTLVSAEFDRERIAGRAGLAFRAMMAGHAMLARVIPGFRYAQTWDVERSTIDPPRYERTLAAAGFAIDHRERAHRHLIYRARRAP